MVGVCACERKIWLIGGTRDSVDIAGLLLDNNYQIVVTVATEGGKNLYASHPYLLVVVGKIPAQTMGLFIKQHGIGLIIDASHPFAVNVSQGAIATGHGYDIPYLRYERPLVTNHGRDGTITFSSFESLLNSNFLQGKRILLTVGCQSLYLFKDYHHTIDLYARVLPYADSLTQAYQAGFKGDRLIALRPPISLDLEKALWQQWHIEAVVTKAGGKAGGEDIKQKVAQKLQIPLILIQRPPIEYPHKVNNLADIIPWLTTFNDGGDDDYDHDHDDGDGVQKPELN